MDDALRKLAQSVQVIRGLHRSAGGDVEGYATKGAVTDPLETAKDVKPVGRMDFPERQTSPMGLYSHAAHAIHGIHVGSNVTFTGAL